ncbi:hypothetical protein GLOIN_2v1787821 [Rhizophagus irregularis DAOM 181602=DAOM 197198]|uniref:Uncharacterized protein n=1 Tax=Rhizophagus irregularis (strain DAOM 181602 / DAOM 197198 / MUCL 43194) TaxID=747089 RepID=A0A2H5R5R6_RHIID|nr:hypothetical protein GLOIN_2v1787821 [Rhizophagus irregularis DAOM 181602=DAOM 197198]POG60468.1 hypothetical protein GLOIN_2v1787821 [Rhizophagus irregularis DAOM 181602=DAOM 197198]GBC13409.1 hypothetical protein GLOIN_2v1787821 [Rhizophagus irregularis DAOM 181602=DAOM 197198]|eukprot:XP_025167334.1 hypothetical protein GLOIN_2v1787821 [Rhizophagus irregularis DAOM 181602=DAOM 197198]
MAEFNTKISNEVTTRLSEINASFTAEFGRINTKLNNKLTAEIEIFRARNAATPQKRRKYWEDLITSRKPAIMTLAVLDSYSKDQQSVSNESEANLTNESETDSRGSSTNSSSSSSGSSGSSQKFTNIISVILKQFIDIFDRIKGANDYSLDQICAVVSVDILSRLGMGVIGKDTIKGFYRKDNISSKNLEKIGTWVDHTHLHRY